jgi:dephospho-CoA kinase
MTLPEVIGIAGTLSSGKDTLAEYLVENYGYTHVSTGDMVRAEAMKRFGNIERPTLQIVGPALRAESGAGVLVAKALEQPRPVIITGI